MGVFDVLVSDEIALAGVFGFFWIAFYLIFFGIGVGSYVLQGISFYTIANRRGIQHAWLSWIPLGNVWILGCISDQYQYVVKRQVKNKRKIMLGLSIAVVALSVLILILCGVLVANAFSMNSSHFGGGKLFGGIMVGFLGILVIDLIMIGLTVALLILEYFCLYDLYTSCDPSNGLTYLLLSIFLSISMPILMFVSRNKDLGMPPRKVEPAQIPAEPVKNPEDNQ